MPAQSKSSPSRFAEKMAKIKIPGLRRSRTSVITDDNSESSSLKTSSSSSVPEENSVGYPSTKSSSSLNVPERSSPRPTSELIAPSHPANLVAPPIPISSPVTVLTLFQTREALVSRSDHHPFLFLHSPHAFFRFRKINGFTRAFSWSLGRLD